MSVFQQKVTNKATISRDEVTVMIGINKDGINKISKQGEIDINQVRKK
jgi:hypothetical protein